MADERAGAEGPRRRPASKDVIQQDGRDANAARPLNAAEDHGGPERYPPVDQTDAVQRTGRAEPAAGEGRSFDPAADPPAPPQGAGDGSSTPVNAGRLGPQGDPAEGKR